MRNCAKFPKLEDKRQKLKYIKRCPGCTRYVGNDKNPCKHWIMSEKCRICEGTGGNGWHYEWLCPRAGQKSK